MAIALKAPSVEYKKAGGGRKVKRIELFKEFTMAELWNELKDRAKECKAKGEEQDYVAFTPDMIQCNKTLLANVSKQKCFTNEQAEEFTYLLRQRSVQDRIKLSIKCPANSDKTYSEIHVKLNDDFVNRDFQYDEPKEFQEV